MRSTSGCQKSGTAWRLLKVRTGLVVTPSAPLAMAASISAGMAESCHHRVGVSCASHSR